jgi:hypothetical protein
MSETETIQYSWTQPCCGCCWQAYSYGKDGEVRQASAIKEEYREIETCVFCGGTAAEGIYLRVDPTLAPFPTKVKDD